VLKANAGGRILLWSDWSLFSFPSGPDSLDDVDFFRRRNNIVQGDKAKPSVSTLPGGFAVWRV
jgi:hypothetical protein